MDKRINKFQQLCFNVSFETVSMICQLQMLHWLSVNIRRNRIKICKDLHGICTGLCFTWLITEEGHTNVKKIVLRQCSKWEGTLYLNKFVNKMFNISITGKKTRNYFSNGLQLNEIKFKFKFIYFIFFYYIGINSTKSILLFEMILSIRHLFLCFLFTSS